MNIMILMHHITQSVDPLFIQGILVLQNFLFSGTYLIIKFIFLLFLFSCYFNFSFNSLHFLNLLHIYLLRMQKKMEYRYKKLN